LDKKEAAPQRRRFIHLGWGGGYSPFGRLAADL
jgi:CRISPR/Cas system CSM-associated protein Csm5 (group 7 of RAMP superfamily)